MAPSTAHRRVILASRSPRRRELLRFLFDDFESQAADIDETPQAGEVPEKYARRLAAEKARKVQMEAVAQNPDWPNFLVIGADTVIDHNGAILGKPVDADEARAMLRALSDQTHTVITGFALATSAGELIVETASTIVTFDPVPDEAIDAYIATEIPFDRAGAYGIQDGFGALHIRKIDGDYNNVVGLPVCALGRALDRLNG